MGTLDKRTRYSEERVAVAVNDCDARIEDLEALAVAEEVGDGTITLAKLEAGILAASADGRAAMADGFFDATAALAKFGANSIANAFLLDAVADGAFAADSSTRALFGSGFVDAGLIGAGAATTAKLGTEVRGAHQALSGAGAINLTTPVTRYTSTGAAQALTLADGTVTGHRKRIIHVSDGGSGVLTAGGSLHLGDSIVSITLANLWDWVELEWQNSSTTWNVVAWGGAGVAFAL
jgi:hypothetical protein